MTEFVSWVSNGKVDRLTHNAIADLLNRLNSKKVRINITEAKKKISSKELRFFHGPFIEATRMGLLASGQDYTPEMVKEIIKKKFGPQEIVTLPNGKQEWVSVSMAKYTTTQAEETMMRCRSYFAPYFELPYPENE